MYENQWIIQSKDRKLIENIIAADKEYAASIGGVPFYDGALIGEPYNPPPPQPTTTDRLAALETAMLEVLSNV